MDPTAQELERIHARYAPVDQRVDELLARIRHACRDLDGCDWCVVRGM